MKLDPGEHHDVSIPDCAVLHPGYTYCLRYKPSLFTLTASLDAAPFALLLGLEEGLRAERFPSLFPMMGTPMGEIALIRVVTA